MTRGPATIVAVIAVIANAVVDLVGVTSPPTWWLPVVIASCAATVFLMIWSVLRPWATSS